MDAGNMLQMKLRRALASQGRDAGPPEALTAPGTLSSVFPFRVSADGLDVPATPPPRPGLVLEVIPVRAAESQAAGRGALHGRSGHFPAYPGGAGLGRCSRGLGGAFGPHGAGWVLLSGVSASLSPSPHPPSPVPPSRLYQRREWAELSLMAGFRPQAVDPAPR